MSELAGKTCVPCRGDVPPLKGEELEDLSRQVPGWEVVGEHHLLMPVEARMGEQIGGAASGAFVVHPTHCGHRPFRVAATRHCSGYR
jgi:hypothetical protein